MGADHRRAHITVPEQLLDRPNVVPGFEQMRGEWHVAGLAVPAARAASFTARCGTDACK